MTPKPDSLTSQSSTTSLTLGKNLKKTTSGEPYLASNWRIQVSAGKQGINTGLKLLELLQKAIILLVKQDGLVICPKQLKGKSLQEILFMIIDIESMDGGSNKTRLICHKIIQVLKAMKIYYTDCMSKEKKTEIKLIQQALLEKIRDIFDKTYK